MMDVAISYQRFSSPKQARGDSTRRQTDLAEQYCERHGLRLIDTFLDAGVSGYTGANLSDESALKALLDAVRAGKFKPGTRLIVESLDRLSRREISVAVRLFLDIIDSGLIIVALIDGEQIFTKERVDNDITALIIAIVILSRANNESKNRRERALQAQEAARAKARQYKIPITAKCPAWLTLVGKGDARRFVVDKGRAKLVQRILKLAASGLGQYEISRILNQENVPTLTGRPKWRTGSVAHILTSQAVIGTYQPLHWIADGGRTRKMVKAGDPIEGYFPAVVNKHLYDRARLATSRRLSRTPGRRPRAYSNLVPRLGRCAVCGGKLA
jgi:DNA invertase Pin-like site-specific DNA recombinase